MSRKVVVIGAGINGLVAANYLRRAGCEVLMLEKKDKVGGACTFDWLKLGGEKYAIPTGASVFGMMQDFVFRETGLDKRVQVHNPKHPGMVFFGEDPTPMRLFEDIDEYSKEAKAVWNETGDIRGFRDEQDKVCNLLWALYREAGVPSSTDAREKLGEETYRRWVTGSATDLFKTYFTSDKTKIFKSMSVNESGPVDLSAPMTAFNIALMAAGSVKEGGWGIVNGALWRLPIALSKLNEEIGVELRLNIDVQAVTGDEVTFTENGRTVKEKVDAVFLATDPMTAAKLIHDEDVLSSISDKKFVGSSGKCVMLFREPAVWKGDSGLEDYQGAFRYFYESDNFAYFEESNRKVRNKEVDFSPCAYQIYPEGPNMRKMGWNENFDYFSVFFKDFALTKKGAELPEIKKHVETKILGKLVNPDAFIGSALFSPKDLQETFFFPGGNIDHMELCQDQNYFARHFSSEPAKDFYRLGNHAGVYYCGAGGFPCGSVAGTVGYLAAKQWLRKSL